MNRKPDAIESLFSKSIDRNWSFKGSRADDTWTHGYHRYPAKFVPSLVRKIIENYSQDNGTVIDLFAGCGTTLVESKMHGLESLGIDINPVAKLITKAKTSPIKPETLSREYERLESRMLCYHHDKNIKLARHQRVDYWFSKREKQKIAFLYANILLIKEPKIKDFFLCALSNILKNCSRWLQTSTKPQIDPDKKPAEPFKVFRKQVKMMMLKNEHYYRELKGKGFLRTACSIKIADARRTGIRSNSAQTIITSPPYVTSYEYADIHQLTGYWFEYINDIRVFRKKFIGSYHTNNHDTDIQNPLAQKIVEDLSKKSKKTAREVAKYFSDMYDVAIEMKRILKKGGRACLVIGNTTLKGVTIKTAEVFARILVSNKFEIENIIRRSIPGVHKQIPTIRDRITGQFTSLSNKNSKLVYPDEYIIIAKK